MKRWLLLAGIVWVGPRQSPAELAAVLRACTACEANVANLPTPWPDGPTSVTIGSPGAASWLEFPAPSPRVRLDGTPIDRPPAQYGLSSGHHAYVRQFQSTVLVPRVSQSPTQRRR